MSKNSVQEAEKYWLWAMDFYDWDFRTNCLIGKDGSRIFLDSRVEVLATMPYRDYLQTPEWQEVRRAALERAGYRCQVCNAATPLDVHHRTYERRGHEHPSDVIALCRTCHELFHFRGKND